MGRRPTWCWGNWSFDTNIPSSRETALPRIRRPRFFYPSGLTVSTPPGRLYVADGINRTFSRVLVFQTQFSPQPSTNAEPLSGSWGW